MHTGQSIVCLSALVALCLESAKAAVVTSNPQASVDLKCRHDARDIQPHHFGVWPPPQEITETGCGIRLNGDVTIVTGDTADEPTISLIKTIVTSAGGKATVSTKPTGKGTQILVGTGAENSFAADAAQELTGQAATDLDAEGYVLATGKVDGQLSVVLNGVDTRGAFYAAQTLRQLVDDRSGVPGIQARDWPLMPVRGSIEGFYGIPWSHEARLDQFVLYGQHKMNTYIYTPKDDELLRRRWRELYEGDDLDKLQELVDTANANHVDFTFALSPGNDLCYSSEDDFNATVAKFDQLRDLGVQRFYIALDDIPTDGFHCDSDDDKWPHDQEWHWLADAQACYLNRVQQEWIEKHGLDALETVPTNYAGSQPDPYKDRFGTQLDKKVRIQWTGEGVFSPNVTVESVVRAGETYVTDTLFFWDNFPVNDGDFSRLFLNPLTEPANGPVYDAKASMDEALRELAGRDEDVHEALVAFVDLNQNWPYREPEIFAPALSKDIQEFWAAREKGGGGPLRERLQLLMKLPELLSRMDMKGFATDVEPWSTAAMQWAKACQHLVAMLEALDEGDKTKADEEYGEAKAWVKKTEEKTVETLDREGNPDSYAPNVGDGVFESFLGDATAVYEGTG
ncbi:F5/8 type C domain protein [Emericellopsis atlantica]|uniref:F5/8 type C domain protein n=1 Tax=Emericellopsis atlantica TaxID=2614577 RepID=A0A9P7ZJ49_9HYPO|nr:F5/8 type C domain protein [Emericellopsis atlantica]KAG9252970.1 F5/8 type C domain protein [Emericellopsis atlantica]